MAKTNFDICVEYDAKFPDTPTATLAKMIYKKNSKRFASLESCRTAVRRLRGQLGEKNRKKDGVDKRTFNFAPFNIPESHATEWDCFVIPTADEKALIINDIHLPYHDVDAVKSAINHGIEEGCTVLIINGDLLDFHTISRFEKDPYARSFSEELEAGRNFLMECKRIFKQVYYKIGNHEERFEKYMRVKAPEILGEKAFKLSELLRQGEIGFHLIEDKRIIRYGHLSILHGHEFFGGTSQAVNPARGLFLKTNESSCIGHLHKTSTHTERTLGGKLISTRSIGCLCHLNPDYAIINKWNHGFAIVKMSKSGDYVFENKTIFDGKIF